MTSNGPTNRAQNKDQTADHFEEHLRRFRPIAPRRLAIPARRAPWVALAVAAGVLLAAGISIVSHHPQQRHPLAQPVTIGSLNAALRDNDETLNRLLDDASPKILVHGQRGTVLYELGKE
jgi:hypothetical protein